MALGKGPSWQTPATIDGLRAENWATREGVTMRGTFSQCVVRWLELHPNNRQDCSIGWGPNEEGRWGYFERPNIVGFLERNGPPPDMGSHVTILHIRNWLSVDKLPPTHGDSAIYRRGIMRAVMAELPRWKPGGNENPKVKQPDVQPL